MNINTIKQLYFEAISTARESERKKPKINNIVVVQVHIPEKVITDSNKIQNKNRSGKDTGSKSKLLSSTEPKYIYVDNNGYEYNTLENTLPYTRAGRLKH